MTRQNARRKFNLPTVKRGTAAIALLLLGCVPAFGQSSDTLSISDTAADAQGRIAVNAAAGDLNQQANSAVLAVGPNAFLSNVVVQTLLANKSSGSDSQSASISGTSFSGTQGAIAVNGAAGTENQQANLAAFGIGIGIEDRVASLELLSQTRSSQAPAGDQNAPASVAKAADISPTAFRDASGLVQVNLTAGERNSSANVFALTLPGGSN